MINRKCECGSHISSYVNMLDLGECLDCHRCYVLKDGVFKKVSKSEFRTIHRNRLIAQQKLNK